MNTPPPTKHVFHSASFLHGVLLIRFIRHGAWLPLLSYCRMVSFSLPQQLALGYHVTPALKDLISRDRQSQKHSPRRIPPPLLPLYKELRRQVLSPTCAAFQGLMGSTTGQSDCGVSLQGICIESQGGMRSAA
jgi:hypothetical protein